MSVIGIDPSLSATGVCWGPSDGETIKLEASSPHRLADLYNRITNLASQPYWANAPTPLAVIEDLPMHAKSAGLTGQAQGVVRLVLQQWVIPFITVAPASLKLFATGSGRASKDMMRSEMVRQFGSVPDGWDDNVIDAFWLREIGVQYLERNGGVINLDHFKRANVAKWSDLNAPPKAV